MKGGGARKRAIGSLNHADIGRVVEVPGYPPGVLWSIQHVGAVGDIPEPWTRIIYRRDLGMDESTRGLPPDEIVRVHPEGATLD